MRKIGAAAGITTIAGNGNAGFSGDGGPASSALLNSPRAVAVDAAGNVYIADTGNYRIRIVTPNGQISTLAGNGIPGFSGDAGPAATAQIGGVVSLAVDASGNVYFSDGTRVRKIFASGFLATIAGTNPSGYSGDGGLASAAQLNGPAGVAVDATGNVYVADSGNNAIRLLQPVAGGLNIGAVVTAPPARQASSRPGKSSRCTVRAWDRRSWSSFR